MKSDNYHEKVHFKNNTGKTEFTNPRKQNNIISKMMFYEVWQKLGHLPPIRINVLAISNSSGHRVENNSMINKCESNRHRAPYLSSTALLHGLTLL